MPFLKERNAHKNFFFSIIMFQNLCYIFLQESGNTVSTQVISRLSDQPLSKLNFFEQNLISTFLLIVSSFTMKLQCQFPWWKHRQILDHSFLLINAFEHFILNFIGICHHVICSFFNISKETSPRYHSGLKHSKKCVVFPQ